ncbi:MAG: hypothetical protein DDT26_02651 [Dehalococcoidia bacterium]|nr:hypothetical protein [Chloroflexota bacterium]
MAIDNGQVGGCRICGDRCKGYEMICPICFQWVLEKAADAETVDDAIRIFKEMLK